MVLTVQGLFLADDRRYLTELFGIRVASGGNTFNRTWLFTGIGAGGIHCRIKVRDRCQGDR